MEITKEDIEFIMNSEDQIETLMELFESRKIGKISCSEEQDYQFTSRITTLIDMLDDAISSAKGRLNHG